jgi:hypothetical protein
MSRWRQGKLSPHPRLKQILALVMLTTFWMAACSPGAPVISVPSEPEPTLAEGALVTDIPSITPAPSPTTESLPGRALLLAPSDGDPLLLAEVQPVLEELVREAGYQLDIMPSLLPQEITPDVRMVVALPPDPGLQRLAASASEIEFLAIGIPGLDESPNLTTVFLQQDGADLQGFMGGVIAALVTPDWRIGVISISDAPDGIKTRTSFMNGAIYFCGTCRQIYPPFFDNQNQLIQYPLYVELPSTASEIEWQTAADYLIERGVKTIYIFPGAGGEGLLDYLAQSGLNIIAGVAPPQGFQENWVASIYFDSTGSLRSLLEMAFSGQELPQVSGELQIGYVNADLFSPGRQKLAQEILEDLLAGYIEPGDTAEPADEQ